MVSQILSILMGKVYHDHDKLIYHDISINRDYGNNEQHQERHVDTPGRAWLVKFDLFYLS